MSVRKSSSSSESFELDDGMRVCVLSGPLAEASSSPVLVSSVKFSNSLALIASC